MWTYLGQNFLIDTKIRTYIADKILALYNTLWCESLIEIWPGKWSITKLIQTISDNFFVVDMDPTFFDNWQLSLDHWQFILSDILELDVQEMLQEKKLDSNKTLIVGNLPYYITSPILRKFFSPHATGSLSASWFAWGIFMVQDEVWQKLRSDAKKKSYLRWLINYWCTVTYLKWVPAKCFKPVPKVKSCLIQLTNNTQQLPIQRDEFVEFLELFAPFSRKTLGAIQTMLTKRLVVKDSSRKDKFSSSDTMMKYIIPEILQKKRLEELSWNDLIMIFSQ